MSVYSTSQVSGMTRLPIKTIQRYIKDFPDAFNEAARKPRKGRRYTAQDVDKLLTIRKMRQTGEKDFEIVQALSGTIDSPALPMAETENILHIAEAARQAAIEAEKCAQRANESNLSIESKLKYYDNQYFEVKKMLREQEAILRGIKDNLKVVNLYMHEMDDVDVNAEIRDMRQQEALAQLPPPEKPPAPLKKKNFIDRLIDKHVEQNYLR